MGAVPRYMRHRPTWQALCPDHVAVLESSIIIMHVVTCQALCPDHVVVLIVGQKKL